MREKISKALQLFDKGEIEEADKIFHEIASQEVEDDSELLIQLGKLAEQLGEDIFAACCFSKVREIQPDNAVAYSLLASVFYKSDRPAPAEDCCHKAIALNPKLPGPNIVLGRIAADRGRFSEAIEFFEKAINLKPSYTEVYLDMTRALTTIDRHDEALIYAKKLLRLNPVAMSYLPISRVLKEMGRMDEAISYLEKALRLDETNGAIYVELSGIKKYSLEDDEFIQRTEKVLRRSIPSKSRYIIHFSLGKIYDDRKEWDKAFEHYRQGNLLGREGVEPTAVQERFKHAKKLYTKKRINQNDLYGSDSEIPVFIVGMPRSGTTLTEQIIASHPDGGGAGELIQVLYRHAMIHSVDDVSKKGLADKLTKERLVEYADEYLLALRDSREDAARIVDKMPDNCFVLGLIHLMFPKARIIHAMRNPLDSCLSCYFQPFASIPESYDLEWLAKRYRSYRKAMDYWKKVLPEGTIFDAHYEDLVGDFETQSRRILEFCGLPWDDKCLEYNKSSRTISTASVWQARQPIYKSSRKRWVNYASHLEVLANGISEYLDDEDISELEKHGVKIKRKWRLGFS